MLIPLLLVLATPFVRSHSWFALGFSQCNNNSIRNLFGQICGEASEWLWIILLLFTLFQIFWLCILFDHGCRVLTMSRQVCRELGVCVVWLGMCAAAAWQPVEDRTRLWRGRCQEDWSYFIVQPCLRLFRCFAFYRHSYNLSRLNFHCLTWR